MLRVQLAVGLAAARTGPLRGMHGEVLVVVEGEERPLSDLERLVDQLLRAFPGDVGSLGRLGFFSATRGFQHTDDDLDVMFLEAVEPEGFVRAEEFSIGADLGVAVLGGPGCNFGMEPLPAPNDGREKQQIAPRLQFAEQRFAHLVAGAAFDGQLAIRAIRGAELGEEQPEEMIDLRHGGHGALASAPGCALLDADRRRNAGDEVDVGPGHLFHELPGVGAHGVEEPALALGKKDVEGQGALARTAHARDDDELPARDTHRDVLQVMLPSPDDFDDITLCCSSLRIHEAQETTGLPGRNAR